jgi:antirestriction protein ArdC
MKSQGGDAYSLEELIAEIGACYLSSHTGILPTRVLTTMLPTFKRG